MSSLGYTKPITLISCDRSRMRERDVGSVLYKTRHPATRRDGEFCQMEGRTREELACPWRKGINKALRTSLQGAVFQGSCICVR